jgi:hypothetical protein
MPTIEQKLTNGKPLVIPTTGDPYSSQRIALDGRLYTLSLAWNQYEESWHLSLFDEAEEPIVVGLRIISNWPLLRYYGFDARMPPGELYAHDLTGDGSPPGLDDFGEGKRVELTYYAQTNTGASAT